MTCVSVARCSYRVCACMQKIRIFDTRDRAKPQLTVDAHAADVNVISWNRLTSFMLASGSDDCSLRVWDLRALENHVAAFSHHAKAITSVEWCPHESSMLATTSEVRQRQRPRRRGPAVARHGGSLMHGPYQTWPLLCTVVVVVS